MGNTLQTANRNYLWDNIKAFLIFTVVFGHFLETLPVNESLFGAIDYWIYTFHMPAFLFVSGYLAKSYCKEGKPRIEKVANFLAYYFIFQILFYLIVLDCSPRKPFSLLSPNIGLWYLLAMTAYYLIIPLAEKLPAYVFIPITIFLGLLIGTESNAGHFLAVSRTFVFAPFFFIGYYSQEKLINLLRSAKGRFFIGLGLCVISMAICIVTLSIVGVDKFEMALFYGKNSYKLLGYTPVEGVIFRTIAWLVGLLTTFGLILIFPKCKTPVSYWGKNTLQIYLFHFILILLFKENDLRYFFPINSIWQGILMLLMAVAFTFLLSIPPLSKPFAWIQKGVNKLFELPKYNGK